MKMVLEEVLGRQQLTPVFQPIVDLATLQIIGYEALIRGPADSPLYEPETLFKVAKQYDLGWELEELCCRLQVRKFNQLELAGLLFLNVSAGFFMQMSLLGVVKRPWYLPELGKNQLHVVVELGENEFINDYDQLRSAMMRCRNDAMQFAIDDLGEGYASLRQWAELSPEFVKIDRYFAKNIHCDLFKQQILRAINGVARKNNVLIIVEGIEDQLELDVLKDIGISHGQGYLLGRPRENPQQQITLAAAQSIMLLGCPLP